MEIKTQIRLCPERVRNRVARKKKGDSFGRLAPHGHSVLVTNGGENAKRFADREFQVALRTVVERPL